MAMALAVVRRGPEVLAPKLAPAVPLAPASFCLDRETPAQPPADPRAARLSDQDRRARLSGDRTAGHRWDCGRRTPRWHRRTIAEPSQGARLCVFPRTRSAVAARLALPKDGETDRSPRST